MNDVLKFIKNNKLLTFTIIMLLLGFWSSGLSGFLSFGFILTIPWYFRYRNKYNKGLVDSKIYQRGIAALSMQF